MLTIPHCASPTLSCSPQADAVSAVFPFLLMSLLKLHVSILQFGVIMKEFQICKLLYCLFLLCKINCFIYLCHKEGGTILHILSFAIIINMLITTQKPWEQDGQCLNVQMVSNMANGQVRVAVSQNHSEECNITWVLSMLKSIY